MTKGVSFQPAKRGQFSTGVDTFSIMDGVYQTC